MNPVFFLSAMAEQMNDFFTFKKTEQYDYSSSIEHLRFFDAYLWRRGYDLPILTVMILEQYAMSIQDKACNTIYNRLSAVRQFSRYLNQFEPRSFVLQSIPVKRPALPRYYIYSLEQIGEILKETQNLRPKGALRPQMYKTLIALLYVSGLRIGEALGLNLCDLQLNDNRIFVRKGKFKKDRWVALDDSAVKALDQYIADRKLFSPSDRNGPAFIDRKGKRLSYDCASATFASIIRRLAIGENTCEKRPRLHDLRHTYATHCLARWQENNQDVNAKLPLLATAMGHVNVSSTAWYLHITSQMLEKANERLTTLFQQNIFPKGEES